MVSASTVVSARIYAPHERFFYWFTAIDIPNIMHKYWIIPAVVGVSDQTGPMHQVGSSWVIHFADGSTAFEEIVSSDPPNVVHYRVSQLTSMFRYLVREGRAQIAFQQVPTTATLVEWRYTFLGHNWAATLLLKLLVPIFWRGFMGSALARAKLLAEAETTDGTHLKGQTTNYPPKGLLRLGFRLPVYFYRLGLGWLLGSRFVLINHLGRKSGTLHQAVVEVVERDKESGSITVVAGYGPQTQWYKNLKAHPATTIQIGSRKYVVLAQFISAEDGEEIMLRYFHRYGKITGKLFSMLGYSWDGTEQGVRQIARDFLRFVHFIPQI